MGEVTLGMPGQWAHDYREKADHYTSKIGGLPDWPDLDIPVSGELLLCGLCGEKFCLVAQIYAPLFIAERSIDERVIYVLGCMKKDCGSKPQSWRVLRLQRCKQDIQSKDEPFKAVQPEEQSTSVAQDKLTSQSSSVKDCDDEESDSDIDLDELAQALEQVSTLASNSKKQNGTKHTNKTVKGPVVKKLIDDSTTPVLPCFYIYSQKESSKGRMGKTNSDGCSSISLKEIEKSSGNESEGESWEGEVYEYDKALGADRTYLKFKKQLDAYPEQCFRYSYGGNPLFPVANVPKPGECKSCGSAKRFELQLMPPLLYFLHEASDESSNFSIDGWTWLTITVCTCSKSCCSGTCGEKSSNRCWCIVEEEAVVIQDD
ncbi:hypothetical protein LUZ61_009403 [Rhynchospora tenuis]|uniref:Programmed cell death protein 2 C-terminal domain-containing protein n=1 Tax=Rhynchospora tenuis TaxID=198213 RepID=A0AAD5ZXG1_9POAL|nr:hypothetical protein LUZ61_009403 [Rhynchospora tenuis]